MKIAVACDHGGLVLKRDVVAFLTELGHEVQDLGTHDATSIDYPDYAKKVCAQLQSGQSERGVLVCGTGQGMAMTANKVPGIRAAVVSDSFSARMAMEHNDARILCLGQRVLGTSLAGECLNAWLNAEFGGGRHARRVAKIEE
jgi:ribose 5-phosphate isomerase B